MKTWAEFAAEAPGISAAGKRLFDNQVVALLGTVAKDGRPRIHPFVPKIFEGRLIAFILRQSYKYHDLMERHWFAIHAIPGPEDEEFYLSGRVDHINDAADFRSRGYKAMGFVHDESVVQEVLFEFRIDRVLHTRWLDFGTRDHRPAFEKWQA